MQQAASPLTPVLPLVSPARSAPIRSLSQRPAPRPVLHAYAPNSPEALARVVALIMVTDTDVDARELAALSRFQVFQRIGLTRPQFMRVARDYCADLVRLIGARDSMRLVDPDLIDAVLAPIDDPRLRMLACRLMVSVVTADGELADPELQVLRHVQARWQIDPTALAEAVAEDLAAYASPPAANRPLPAA